MTEKAWFIDGGALYVTVVDAKGEYWFCNGFTGTPRFQKTVENYTPRQLPVHDGEAIALVGIPKKEDIEQVPLLDAKGMYSDIEMHLKKYLDAPDVDIEMFVYYVLYSWMYMKTNTAPYLRFIADTGNGKSRFQKVCGHLCFYPIKANGASSASGIMRLKEKWHGTLLIDEADLRDSTTTNELVKYLNLGFEKDQFFIKSDKDNLKEQDVFDQFCPKVIAMRVPFQDNATEGRLLSFIPQETTRTDIPILLPDTYDREVDVLRAKITRFVQSSFEKVTGNQMDLSGMAIEPRLKQLALPLSMVLQLFPDGESRFRAYLNTRQKEIKRVRAASFEGIMFNSVLDVAKDSTRITASSVKDAAGAKSAQSVSRTLHSIGFKTEVVKQDKTLRILVVPDERTWTGICQRYYFSDDDKTPECPEAIRGTRFAAAQQAIT